MIYPDKAFYRPGDTVRINVPGPFRATIWNLLEQVVELQAEDCLVWTPPAQAGRGYLVRAETEQGAYWTAFDVLEKWTDAPRYGYLFDFSPGRSATDLRYLLAHHVNGVQFYDWLYRHDQLLPSSRVFVDPLGRSLSLDIVAQLIDTAHQLGMAAMPYTAVYAASPAFAAQHMAWGLYDDQHTRYDFADGFLKIMNPASAWRGHFINECLSVFNALPFDGIHVDQYGEPQSGYDQDGQAVDLPRALADSLQELHAAMPHDKALVFNLVHNWPLKAVAETEVDFLYCEIWPPEIRLGDLAAITRQNWLESGGKPPVVAVYIDPQNETTAKIVESVILASGGYHLIYGEDDLYLSDPYFPKAVAPSVQLADYLQRSADFAVAYQQLLARAEPIDAQVDLIEDIILVARRTGHQLGRVCKVREGA